jgi:hypothetical protein
VLTKFILAAFVIAGIAVSSASRADVESQNLNTNSFQQIGSAVCPALATYCDVNFSTLTDTTTVITAVSCSINVTPGSFVGMSLGTSFGNTRFYMQSFVFAAADSLLTVATNSATNMFFKKGERPFVEAFISNGGAPVGSLVCTISGYHS